VLGEKNYYAKLFMFAIVSWGLWNIRNKMSTEKRFTQSSNEVFHKIFQYLQKWRMLLKEQDACKIPDTQERKNEEMAEGFLEAN
jgi:hypothetical protein